MKVISFQDVQALNITPRQCYDWAAEMIKNKEQSLLPPKISMKPADGIFCNVMPAMIIPPTENAMKWSGVKVVTRYPDRQPSVEGMILLLDAESGKFLALIDGTWITTMRTGAVAAHSILLFGKDNFSTIGILGLGNTARATIEVLESQIEKRELNIKLLRYKNQEIDFSNRFKHYDNLHFTFVNTAKELVKGSDVVVSGATYLPKDICEDEFFDEGILVVPIHTLGFTNCDLFFDKVFADDEGHVKHFKNYGKFKKFAEVCDVVNGRSLGRETQKERILVYNIGISLHDINYAAKVYQLLDGVSTREIDLKEPVNKFWV